MKLEDGRKHVLYDMCLGIIAKAEIMPPDDIQEVIVALRAAGGDNYEDQKALNLIAEALAPYIDL